MGDDQLGTRGGRARSGAREDEVSYSGDRPPTGQSPGKNQGASTVTTTNDSDDRVLGWRCLFREVSFGCSAIALFFLPIVFGGLALLLGIVVAAMRTGESWPQRVDVAARPVIAALVATLVGWVFLPTLVGS